MRALPFLLLATAAAAQEPQSLLCTAKDGARFGIMLDAPSDFGPLHCVEAPSLRDTLVPCAPQGGWGLSAPDGMSLQSVTTDPAQARGERGIFFARLGPSELVASASSGPLPPLALEVAGDTFWRLRLTLATGEGLIATPEGEQAIRCEAL